MPRFSNGREGSTKIGNLGKVKSNLPAPEWRHGQAPILLSENTPNSIEQPQDMAPRVYNAPKSTKRKSPPETLNLPPTAKARKLDERGPWCSTGQALACHSAIDANVPKTKDPAETRSVSTAPEVAPQEKKCALVWRVRHFSGAGGKNSKREDSLQPRQDAGEHSATTRREDSTLEPKKGTKDWIGHKSQMHSWSASDSVRDTSTEASSTVEDDAGDMLARKFSRMVPFASKSMTLPADAEFSIADVERAVDVLTTISNICETISGQPRADTRAKLHDEFVKLPNLLTREGRDKQPKLAAQFRELVYRHPDSGRWGPIESFEKLGDDIMGLTLFRARSRTSPKERHPGVFEV
ncbi:hypothetical protein Neosp_002398 [[Neocosmospora] mangrovei]